MEKTKNYGFNKPDLTDPATIDPLNANFDKIDEELMPYRVSILTDIDMTIASGNEFAEYDLTEELSPVVLDLMWSGLWNRRLQISMTDSTNGMDFVVELNEKSSSDEKRVFSGVAPNPSAVGKVSRFDLEIYQKETETEMYPVKLLVSRTVSGTSSGNGDSPAITAISVTEAADGTVTMVNALANGGTETLVLSPDANGNPNKLTYNGTEIPITWNEVTV